MLFIILCILFITSLVFSIQSRNWEDQEDGKIAKIVGGVFSVIFAVLIFFQFITIVDAGTVEVQKTWGSIHKLPLEEGVNFINPFSSTEVVSVKTMQVTGAISAPSKEGMNVTIDVSVLVKVLPSAAPGLLQTVGDDFYDIIIVPQVRSVVRGITAKYEAKALYTEARELVASESFDELGTQLGNRFIVEKVLLRSVVLPPKLAASIEEKLQAEQTALRMEFVLQKETQEAERKRIEAKGIQDFQTIVSKGINENLLRWKGIEATENLANSTNSKIVVIGSGKDGLPLILGK